MASESTCGKLGIFILIIGAQILSISCERCPRILYAEFNADGKPAKNYHAILADGSLELIMTAINSPLMQDPFKVILQVQVLSYDREAEIALNPEAIILMLGNKRLERTSVTTIVTNYKLTDYGRQLPQFKEAQTNRYPEFFRIRNVYETSFPDAEQVPPEVFRDSMQMRVVLNDFIVPGDTPIHIDTIAASIPITNCGEVPFVDESLNRY